MLSHPVGGTGSEVYLSEQREFLGSIILDNNRRKKSILLTASLFNSLNVHFSPFRLQTRDRQTETHSGESVREGADTTGQVGRKGGRWSEG